MENPTKVDFRLTRKSTTLGGVPIKAGTVIMLCLGAANRDPRKFETANEFRLDRKTVREHIAFGAASAHRGAPLARVEGRVTMNGCSTGHGTSQSSRHGIDLLVHGNTSLRRPSAARTQRAAHRVHASTRVTPPAPSMTFSRTPTSVGRPSGRLIVFFCAPHPLTRSTSISALTRARSRLPYGLPV